MGAAHFAEIVGALWAEPCSSACVALFYTVRIKRAGRRLGHSPVTFGRPEPSIIGSA